MFAEKVTFVGDECGWEMHVETDDGVAVFNVQAIAVELAAHADATIGAYRREHDFHRAAFLREARYSNDPTELEESGYAADDPKHPEYRERMASIWDNRDKEAR